MVKPAGGEIMYLVDLDGKYDRMVEEVIEERELVLFESRSLIQSGPKPCPDIVCLQLHIRTM
jgi:hypothetical protein